MDKVEGLCPARSLITTAYLPGGRLGRTKVVKSGCPQTPHRNSARATGAVPGASSRYALRMVMLEAAKRGLLLTTVCSIEPKFEASDGMEFCLSEKTSPCCIWPNIWRAAESMDDLVGASISEAAVQASAPASVANDKMNDPHNAANRVKGSFARI